MRPRRLALSALCLLAFALPAELCADDGEAAGARVLVVVLPDSGHDDAVREVVATSIMIDLEQAGIVAFEGDMDAVAHLGASSGVPEVDAVLLATLQPSGATLDLSLELRGPLSGTADAPVLATTRSLVTLDLSLDRSVAALVDAVLGQAKNFLRAAAVAREEAAAQQAAAAPQAVGDGASGATPGSGEGPSGTDVPTSGGGTVGVTPQGPVPLYVSAEPEENHFVTVATTFAPLLPIALSAEYMGMNLGGTAAVTFTPFTRDTIGFGLFGRFMMGTASGVALDAALVTIPISLFAQLSGSGGFAPYTRLGAGIALIQASTAALGDFSTIAPYAFGAIGLRVRIAPWLSVNLGIGFEAIFERSLPIMGFTPEIGVALEI